MAHAGTLLVLAASVVALAAGLPSLKSNEPPRLIGDQGLVSLQADPILSDPEVQICNGPEDCNEHGVCDTNGLCHCSPGWGGVDCTVEFVCPNDCSGNGVCRAHSCFCYHGYTGRDCSVALFCPNSCSGNGKCDRGQCMCDVGFDGEDCSIEVGCAYQCVHGSCVEQVCVCDEGYYGADCSDIDYCITNCSNHGACKDRRCICDFGYTGVVCSSMIPCPHNCSHRGECVNGSCQCDLGFTGLDCSEDCCPDQNSQCSAGKVCQYPPCHCHNDCNDNGICHRGRCICRQMYFGDDCAQKYCKANCSGHGLCDHSVGECTCDDGWKGEDCSTVECLNDCSGRGECVLFGGASRICLCEEGYTGHDCSEEVPCPGDCSGNGMCKKGECLCQNGWDGPDCSEEIEQWVPCENDCNSHGDCEEGVCVRCDEGWEGKFCGVEKPTVVADDGTVVIKCPGEPECGGHGVCGPSGKCFCAEEWLGHDCSIKKCPDECNGRGSCRGGRCMCDPPYHSGPAEACEFIHCPANCSGATHGSCNKETGKCSCFPPWTSDDCGMQPCPGDPECSDQGQCDHNTGVCDCLPDYAGEDCSIFMRCPNDCGGNGVCYRGVCYCYSNYTGAACKTIKRPPPPPGQDWQAPLKAAQALFATSRSTTPPAAPEPTSFSEEDKKSLFKSTYGEDWLRYWNMVHLTNANRNVFTKAVTEVPPSTDPADTNENVEKEQMELFKKVFGEEAWQGAWDQIMSNPSIRSRFQEVFQAPAGDPLEPDSEARGPGLPPPPPPARDAQPQVARQKLFTDVFGEGEGLAYEMLIFGNRTRRDMFTLAFSDFLKGNAQRKAEDKRASWEDDMMQVMTDAFGNNGPKILGDILVDAEKAAQFRSAFAGYLEETPTTINTLIQVGEGSSDESGQQIVENSRRIPPAV